MERLHKLLLPTLLLAVIISSLGLPVSAGNGIAKIVVEPRIITISVSSTFTIDIWIRDLSSDFMQEFDFTITWDPDLMEIVSNIDHVLANDPNWIIKTQILNPASGTYRLNAWTGLFGSPVNEDLSWVTLTFHCRGVGSSPVNIQNTVIYRAATGAQPIAHEVLKGAVTQEPATPVGGYVTPINKLEILTPYIAIAGLIAAVSAVYVIKRRKE
ncbi:MAG: hypothetical protein WBF08_08275 [Candidatus Bathyarchaeia archaeon]